MKGRVRLTNFSFNKDGFDADIEVLADAAPAVTPVPAPLPIPVPTPAPAPVHAPVPAPRALPHGFNSDPDVAFHMLVEAMDAHGLTPVGVQGHGAQIVAALNDTWPGLGAYVHPVSDAVMWPGFGSAFVPVDVTIDSGNGGWSFQLPNK